MLRLIGSMVMRRLLHRVGRRLLHRVGRIILGRRLVMEIGHHGIVHIHLYLKKHGIGHLHTLVRAKKRKKKMMRTIMFPHRVLKLIRMRRRT